jgi:hypothetical protein
VLRWGGAALARTTWPLSAREQRDGAHCDVLEIWEASHTERGQMLQGAAEPERSQGDRVTQQVVTARSPMISAIQSSHERAEKEPGRQRARESSGGASPELIGDMTYGCHGGSIVSKSRCGSGMRPATS